MGVTLAALTGAVAEAVAADPADGGLGMPVPSEVALRPVDEGGGDFVCALPARLAARTGQPAAEVAGTLAARLRVAEGVAGVAHEQGILAITLEDTVGIAAEVVAAGEAYGRSRRLDGTRLTAGRAGPAELASAPSRAEAVRMVKDEALGRIAEAAGADVTWEPARVAVGAAEAAGGEGLQELVAWGDEPALRYVLVRAPEGHAEHRAPESPRTSRLVARCRRVWGEPAFEVRYACAHIAMTLRNAEDLGVDPHEAKPKRFEDQAERAVLKAVVELPGHTARAARRRDVTVLTRHLEATAKAYQRLADTGRVLPRGPEPVTDMHRSRVLLTAAVRTSMAAGLAMLGVAVPDRM